MFDHFTEITAVQKMILKRADAAWHYRTYEPPVELDILPEGLIQDEL